MKKFFGKNNFVKKIYKGMLGIILSFTFFSYSFGDYNSFLSNLRQLGINVDSILQSKEIDRYELTRLLNGVNCKDCVNPDDSMTNKYTHQRRNTFSSIDGNAFADISYLGGNYKGQSYYYCVAYVGDNSWMRGYPNSVSPICNGKFCGTRAATLGEFLQVVLNIADQYVYKKYLVNWTKVKTWMDGLVKGSYADTYLTNDEKSLITQYAKEKKSGVMPSEEAFQAYIKYCMFNLDDCGMQSFGVVGQGYWPVAELNILYDNNIVEYEKFVDGQTSTLVDGKYVLEVLYNLFELIDCSFEYDYDCDSLTNKNDNCPNTYNPTQTDTDGDGIGDVCDDDIDGDGVKNPVGIVDDLGNIIISKYNKNMDNCIFMPNTRQTDSNKDGLGDECDKGNDNLGVYIKTSPIKTNAPVTVTFEAVSQGNVKGDFQWSFGDGGTAVGKQVSHTFEKFGQYTVQVSVQGYNNNAKANTTILIGKNPDSNFALSIDADKQIINAGEEITFTLNKQGNFDTFQWNFGDGNAVEQNKATVTKRFKDEGNYMVTVKGLKDGKIVAVANAIVGVGGNKYGSTITPSIITPNKGEKFIVNTNVDGFSTNDISDIIWDFGNGKISNKNLSFEHTYDKEGVYVMMQTIYLKNGISLNNFATIYVGNPNINNSYAIETDIDNLVLNSDEKIGFNILERGVIPNVTLVLNSYNDGYSEKTYDNLDSWPKTFSHQYTNGIFFPKTIVYVDDCISVSTEATVVIDNGDICLKALLEGTLKDLGGDMDGDGIPDICDDDIDGDGHPNLIGIVKPNSDTPEINENNVNANVLKLHKGVCQLDNCPTIVNKNQLDLNNNGWGDECDSNSIYKNIGSLTSNIFNSSFSSIFNSQNNGSDRDGDGIIDTLDACPELPENYNGVQDFDGCPEIGADNNCSLTNYNYINRDFSVYPTITQKTGRLYIINPTNLISSCKGDDCKSLCLGDVANCDSCNGNPNCDLCKQHPEFCGIISGGTGPYTITAWCSPENTFHIRHGITDNKFSFDSIFKGSCPCKKCHWFAKDVNGLMSSIGNFSVCNEECSSDDGNGSGQGGNGGGSSGSGGGSGSGSGGGSGSGSGGGSGGGSGSGSGSDGITIDNPDDIIPPCKGDDCNICEGKNCDNACVGNTSNCISCNGDKDCELCKQNPELCGSRSGGTGPFELDAWCEDDPINIYKWYNITNRQFSFSEYFELKSECRACHRFVIDSKGLTSSIGDFDICPGSGTISGPTGNVAPSCVGGNCTINECTGSNCNEYTENNYTGNYLCVGDIQECPSCPNPSNPACNDDCTNNPGSCGCRSGREGPVSISARCDDNPSKKYIWNNIGGQCLSFDKIFINTLDQGEENSCNQCHRYLTDKWGQNSNTNDFEICGDGIDIIDPTRPEYTCTGSNCNVCEGNNCDCIGDGCGICIGSIDDCNSCNGDINCELCKQNPELCGSWSGGTGPFDLEARCEDDTSNVYRWYDIKDNQFSFTNIWTGECPCKSCHRKIKDSNGLTSSTGNFSVCADACYERIEPEPIPQPVPNCQGDECEDTCTGDVNNCPCKDNPNCPDIECKQDPNCTSCKDDPEHSASWTGSAKGPFSVTAWCDDDGQEFTRDNISGYCFNFSDKFQGDCAPRSCHRYVSASNGLRSTTSDFTVDPIDPNECISPNGPDPTPGCSDNNCSDICVGDISKCPCENNPSCSALECSAGGTTCGDCSGSSLAATWETELEGPYDLTARCPSAIGIKLYKWKNIENTCLSLINVFEGDCPCKTCFWYVETSDGDAKSIVKPFQVCGNQCSPDPWIEPEPIPQPVPGCQGGECDDTCTGDVNNCSCKDNPNCPDLECEQDPDCTSCKEDPKHSASWTGTAKGPFSVTAWCDDDGQEFTRDNISGYCFNFSDKFQGDCEPRSCHRYVSSSNGLRSTTSDFTVDSVDSDECLLPYGPSPLNGCTGDDCNNICVGDLENCPCENNPSCSTLECSAGGDICGNCTNSKLSAKWKSRLAGPFTVTVVCDGQIKIWSDINNNCIGLDNVLEGSCPCKICKWSVSVKGSKKTITSKWKEFQVCGEGCEPEPECGDGNIDNGETCQTCTEDLGECIHTCDDGDIDNGETCSNCPQDLGSCTSSCGNGILESPEQCDYGLENGINGLCSDDCKDLNNDCGDGKVDEGEECDNGNNNGINKGEGSCTIACTYFDPEKPKCGNGMIDEGEDCNTCEIDLGDECMGICGDGALNNGEECDNGDNNGKDGVCSFECKKVKDKDKYCGNGKIDKDLGEECDLGKTNGLSVCSTECKFFSEIPVCGDGIVDKDEECDYGKNMNGKKDINCDDTCRVIKKCGNDKIDDGETCQTCPEDLGDKCKPEPGPDDEEDDDIISNGPELPVGGCTSGNCNPCVGDINSCNTVNSGDDSGSGPLCGGDENSSSYGTWTGGKGPYFVSARCDDNGLSDLKQWYNISGQCLSFENIFEADCPCRVCHWFVQDINGKISDILDFKVCKEECKDPDNPDNPNNPDNPVIIPDNEDPIITPECLSCPCNYTDFGNTLSLNDDVKAILLDLGMTTLYSESIPVGIMQYLNQ